MSRKNTREIELAFSKHRDPDWEADVEIYGKRVLKTVRGICLGDEWTEIDSLKNKDWIELSDMFGNFDNHNPYFNHSPQYVLLDKFSITYQQIYQAKMRYTRFIQIRNMMIIHIMMNQKI